MDLSQMAQKAENRVYVFGSGTQPLLGKAAVLADFELIRDNCVEFNGPGIWTDAASNLFDAGSRLCEALPVLDLEAFENALPKTTEDAHAKADRRAKLTENSEDDKM